MEHAVKMCPKCNSKNIFLWMGASGNPQVADLRQFGPA